MRFLDFFSGIGGFRIGLEMAGHKCVGHCEIDKYANKSYIAMHEPKEDEWYATDITKVKAGELPRADIWCFGFPCQDISVAGKQRGLEGARSGLFYTVIELVKGLKDENKPSILFIENVKNLLSVNGGWDFANVLISLDEAGYDGEWQVLNSKDYRVPQNRERVFIIGHLRGRSTRKVFPLTRNNPKTIKRFQGDVSGKRYRSTQDRVYFKDGIGPCLTTKAKDIKLFEQFPISIGYKSPKKYIDTAHCLCARDFKGISNQPSNAIEIRAILTPDRINKRQNGRRFKDLGDPMFTLTTQDKHGIYIREANKKGYSEAFNGDSINFAYPNSATRRGRVGKQVAQTLDTQCNQGTLVEGKIRRLTPKECFRLQGFSDEYFSKASSVCSDTQLYRQAGNSVTVNVIYEIAKRLT